MTLNDIKAAVESISLTLASAGTDRQESAERKLFELWSTLNAPTPIDVSTDDLAGLIAEVTRLRAREQELLESNTKLSEERREAVHMLGRPCICLGAPSPLER